MNKNIFIKLMAFILSLYFIFSLTGCSSEKNDDIVILYTGDVSCAIDDNIGYAGVMEYKKLTMGQTPYVSLVDLGNAIQGNYIGTISKGTHIVDAMNKVGYDFAVLGNHEFDYGLSQLSQLIDRSNAQYLNCNITYQGEYESALKETKPYKIVKYGDKKVAFIGVTTPKTLTKTVSSEFKENGVYMYDFKSGSNGTKLYNTVQGYANECRNKGADYVIVLSHLGEAAESRPYTSTGLIAATFDIDAVLDAHSGNEISSRVIKNKQGEYVTLSSVGKELSNIGKLVITPNGTITTSLISGFPTKNTEFNNYYKELKATFEEETKQVVASCDATLKTTDEDGVPMVKTRETTIGNFCADAYRTVAEANIAMITADRIQGNLPVGDVLYSDILNLQPHGDALYKIKVSGQEILDMLEIASMNTQSEYSVDEKPVGENDNFLQVSGMKYTINTNIKSTVRFDDEGMFKEVEGDRRVSNVQVLNSYGSYTFINPNGEYTLATNGYLVKDSGGGIDFLQDNSRLIDGGMPDYQVLLDYINEDMAGQLSARYATVEGRIIVK